MIALGRALAARGHDVTLETWRRWRGDVEREGMRFAPAPEYQVFPSGGPPLDFYGAAERAARETLELVRDIEPEVVVADILTLAPALAAEMRGVPRATLVPHVLPYGEDGFPVYSLGARYPRTAAGRLMWRALRAPVARGEERGRLELNAVRANLGLAPQERTHGGMSEELVLVSTLPELEYPRRSEDRVHVIGPLLWEPGAEEVALPAGDGPLVLVAPSTAQDSEHRLLWAAVAGLRGTGVRVLATYNRRLPSRPLPLARNVSVVEWVSYARTMPSCDVVVCHAGHGTLVRALASGCAIVACPAAGDMAENAARVDWAGAGVRLPRRLLSPATLRWAVMRALGEPAIRERARAIAERSAAHDAAAVGAELVEELAARHA
ncbi:MAG TPA: nucleotide disphospho-sugar-binding domain-containing protein [Solirubrobacteraceae bacterium]|nr:nucleotide disphospho-sugar-binding domain-containing protein [Solirubrobacteraceae bacterium]